MYSPEEIVEKRKYNYKYIYVLIRVSYFVGVNLTRPTFWREALRAINIILWISSAISLYGHYSEFERSLHSHNIPTLAESVFTGLQTIVALFKMIYYLKYQHLFYKLIDMAQSHGILQDIKIFQQDFEVNKIVREKIEAAMTKNWRDIRRQLIFYTITVSGILINYFFPCLILNSYHKIKKTPGYVHFLPYPTYYKIWGDKGMQSPYYDIQMYLASCALYSSGIYSISFEGVFIILSCHSVGLAKVLQILIEHSTSELVPPERRVEYLRACIFHYERLSYVDEVRMMFKHIILSQFILTLIIFGFVLFETNYGLNEDITVFIRMVMYICAAGPQILFYCVNGQRLWSASEDIPLAFYNCNWYDESKEFKDLIYMMIMRTNKPFQMEVSYFTTMSLATLISLFRMSGSYFLILRNLDGK